MKKMDQVPLRGSTGVLEHDACSKSADEDNLRMTVEDGAGETDQKKDVDLSQIVPCTILWFRTRNIR